MTQIPASKVLLPLYIYPGPGAWDPLFKAIESNPTLNFIIIVNPNSGPGSEPWWPNADYVREIPKLNAYPNVKTVGYVSTGYCKRSTEEMLADIEKYGQWSNDDEKNLGLGVHGIFFDETPNVWSETVHSCLHAITSKARSQGGLLGNGQNLVIHNPGTAVDVRFVPDGPDISTVSEVSHSQFQTAKYQKWLETSPYNRDQTSFMIYAVPEMEVDEFVLTLRKRAEYLFVTDLKEQFYHNFGQSWHRFIAAMAK